MRDPNWDLHKNDPDWPYDEFGFAKGLPEDHPARAFMAAMDIFTGEKDRVHIESDYTDEFLKLFTGFSTSVWSIKVTTHRDLKNYAIQFYFEVSYFGKRYRYAYYIPRMSIRTAEEFDTCRLMMFRQAAGAIIHETRKSPPTEDEIRRFDISQKG